MPARRGSFTVGQGVAPAGPPVVGERLLELGARQDAAANRGSLPDPSGYDRVRRSRLAAQARSRGERLGIGLLQGIGRR